jgi:hypothetical protein
VSRQNRQSGDRTTIDTSYEVRRIVIARGIQRNSKDMVLKYEEALLDKSLLEDELAELPKRARKKRRALKKQIRWKKMDASYYDLALIPDSQGKILHRFTLKDRGAGVPFRYEYRSDKQRVLYRIRIVETKAEYRKWLQTPGVHVIYSGHSRYGRGACFGNTPKPGDRWEDGTGCTKNAISSKDGLLRLGFDIVGIPITDIVKHGYHMAPVQGNLALTGSTCHPEVMKNKPIRRIVIDSQLNTKRIRGNRLRQAHEKKWGHWKWDGRRNCIKIACDRSKFDLSKFVYKANPAGPFWGYRKKRKGKWRLHLLLRAGWKDTHADPWELHDVQLKCKVFCHFGCSSLRHFRPILRGAGYKNWKRTGSGRSEDRFAYFTTKPARNLVTAVWLWALFQYPKRSKGKSWGPCFRWATRRANRKLGRLRRKYGFHNFKIV